MFGIVKKGNGKYTRSMLKERQSAIWSERVLRLRVNLGGISQDELADRLGVSRVAVTWWESGKHVPQRIHRGLIEKLERESGADG